MHSVFRLPWSSEPGGDGLLDKAALAKSCGMVEIPFMSKLKRKRVDSPEAGSPRGLRQPKRWKSSYDMRPVLPYGQAELSSPAPAVQPVCAVAPAPAHLPPARSVAPAVVLAPQQQQHIRPHLAPMRPRPLEKELVTSDAAATQPDSRATPKRALDAPQVLSSAPNTSPDMAADSRVAALQDTIEAQFNYEILLKHGELRLIEQELAKCQVALEQLRRCQIVPYPGALSSSEDVSLGQGFALEPRPGFTRPRHAAPWGVTDGPYTRHYSKWLIPDPRFDSVPEGTHAVGKRPPAGFSEGRATRGSLADQSGAGPSSRSSRAVAASKLHTLSSDYPPPRDKQGPLIVKRSSDGRYVKLVCNDCHRGNFSSAQGFLNHCRIAHHRDFKSHDAAALACGRPVDDEEMSASIRSAEPATAPLQVSGSTPLVHPLIRSAPLTGEHGPTVLPRSRPYRQLEDHGSTASKDVSTPRALSSKSFVPSPQTPHLSALLKKRGFGGDLDQIVAVSQTKLDLAGPESSSDGEAELDSTTPSTPAPANLKARSSGSAPSLARQPARPAGMALASLERPLSRKGQGQTFQPGPSAHPAALSRASPGSPAMQDLSPHTAESSNPGLVSDREDDDGDEDEEYADAGVGNTHESGIAAFAVDDVEVEDASDDGVGGVGRVRSMGVGARGHGHGSSERKGMK